MIRRSISLSFVLAAGLAAAGSAAARGEDASPQLLRHLPRDSIFAVALFDRMPHERWDSILELAERFLSPEQLEEMNVQLSRADETLGVSLRDDLLAQIGPGLALVLDIPDIDETVQTVMMGQADASETLGGIGLLTQVRDRVRFETAIATMFARTEAEASEVEGLTRIRFPMNNGEDGSTTPGVGLPVQHLDVFYGSAESLFALGFSEGFVQRALAGYETGASLAAGEDFTKVFRHLDNQPFALTYVNVPKIVQRIVGSEMATTLMSSSEKVQPVFELLNSPEVTGLGLGSTSVRLDGGTRTTTYGPNALLGGTLQTAIISAVMIPNFLDALDKARVKRTRSDMLTAAAALEDQAASNGGYPGPTDGWVELGSILDGAGAPTEDGWGHSLWYASDGSSYQLLSHGKDGVRDEPVDEEATEWSLGATEAADRDIVLADGSFIE